MTQVATVLCLIVILGLFWTERMRAVRPSAALIVPTAWMFIAGSRRVSSWLGLSSVSASPMDYAEGSPIDAAAFFALILAGIGILVARRINWARLFAENPIITVYFIYCLASAAWTDEPFILLKRWIKDIGNPIMALVILTESYPYEAFAAVLRRLSFICLPLSILFIRYYPDLGRSFRADGSPMFTGVGHQKNDLGLICLLSGIYVVWTIIGLGRDASDRRPLIQRAVLFLVALMAAYLLYLSNSQTSLVCLIIVTAILFLGSLPVFEHRPNAFFGIIGSSCLLFWAVWESFEVKNMLFELLGRNPTLTNRTDVWEILRDFDANPIFGAGFMSFWTGDRMETLWRRVGAPLIQAHNGYLEQYLNLGYVGVALILAIVFGGLMKARRQMYEDRAGAILRVALIICAVAYNYTEASFYGVNNMWLLLLLACLDVPRRSVAPVAPPSSERRVDLWESGHAIGQR